MFWKICKSLLGKSSTNELPKVFVGRMNAEMTHGAIKKELESEAMQHGLRNLGITIEQEQVALKKLLLEKREVEQKIQAVCITPLLNQFEKGYGIKGLTWQLNQERLRTIITPEALLEREEQIDWLRTRHTLFRSMEKTIEVDPKYKNPFINTSP
jgi:hypothetical protein